MFKIARNELKLFFSDRRDLLLTFLLPIALISLFALAFGGARKKEQHRQYELPVSDEDSTEASRRAITLLDSEETITTVMLPLPIAREQIRKGKKSCVLIFHKGFSDSLQTGKAIPVELQYDEAEEVEVRMLQQSLLPFFFRLQRGQNIKRNLLMQAEPADTSRVAGWYDSIAAVIQKKYESSETVPPEFGGMNSSVTTTALIAPKKENILGLIQAVAGTAVMMLLFSVAGMGAGLLKEKEEGTLKKLLCSPIEPNSILFGKMFAANVVSITQLLVMFLFAWLVFGLNIFQNIPSLLLLILATSFACSGFGIFLASVAKTRQQVQGLSTLIILAMSAIGGSMVPSFIMPEWMQQVSIVSVNYWSIQGFFDIFWRQLPATDSGFLFRLLVLLLIGLLMTLVSLRFYKRNIIKIY